MPIMGFCEKCSSDCIAMPFALDIVVLVHGIARVSIDATPVKINDFRDGTRAVQNIENAQIAMNKPLVMENGDRSLFRSAVRIVPVARVEIGRASCRERVCQYV